MSVADYGLRPQVGYGRDLDVYTRPADWLPLPEVVEGDQKAVGLFAVYDVPHNYLALVAEGNYQVDWGDGSAVELVASGVQAEHDYVYADIASSTLCSRGYRQVIVTVTPQTGVNLTKLIMSEKHSGFGTSGYPTVPWLDINMAGEELLVAGIIDTAIWACEATAIERFNFVGTNKITDFMYFFADMYALQKVEALFTGEGTTFNNMFFYAQSIPSVPAFDTTKGTDFAEMFTNCYALKNVPLLDTSKGTTFRAMFNNCQVLRSVPAFDTSLGTDFSDMFYACYSLENVPALNTSLGTNFSKMFYGCNLLKTAPVLDTSNGLNFLNMFAACYALSVVPDMDTANGTEFSGMFMSGQNLRSVGVLNIGSATTLASMFFMCPFLQEVGVIGASVDISLSGCILAHDALVAVFTGLATVVGKTITITGNPGVADLTAADRLIATAKGWTIVS